MVSMDDPLARAAAHRRAGRHAEAKRLCREILDGDPGNVDALSILGSALAETDAVEAAAALFRRAVAARPDAARLHQELGNVLIRLGDMDGAAAAFGKCIQLDPGRTRAGIFLSAVLRKQNRTRDAQVLLHSNVARRPFTTTRCQGEAAARVLRLRGVQNAFFTLGRNRSGYLKTVLSTGNFSIRYLVDRRRFDICEFLMADDNLLTAEGLPAFDIIVNSVADMDVEAKSLRTLGEFLRHRPDVPVVNPPERVLKTSRDGNYRRLKDVDGVVFPKTVRLRANGASEAAVAKFIARHGFSFPVILRRPGTQTGKTASLVKNCSELAKKIEGKKGRDFYVIQFYDEVIEEKYYRKMRFFCIDGKLFPIVCHIDGTWMVHGSNRKTTMKNHEWMIDEEKQFMTDPRKYIGKSQYDILERFYDIIGLDFFSIDFNIMKDGRLLIFETNATVRHSLDHARHFPYLTPHMNEVSRAFEAMVVGKVRRARESMIDGAMP